MEFIVTRNKTLEMWTKCYLKGPSENEENKGWGIRIRLINHEYSVSHHLRKFVFPKLCDFKYWMKQYAPYKKNINNYSEIGLLHGHQKYYAARVDIYSACFAMAEIK